MAIAVLLDHFLPFFSLNGESFPLLKPHGERWITSFLFFFKLLAMVYLAKSDLLHFYPVRVDQGEFFLLLEPRGER